jgi:hypothetical protein
MENTSKAMDLSTFRVVRHLTRPLLKMQDGVAYYVQVEAPIFQAEQSKNPKKGPDGAPVPPPFILHATNLEDGSSVQMIANEVLKSELEKQYKDNGYVGKYFELIKNTKAEGKRYNTFGITELAPAGTETETEVPKESKKK